VEDGKTIERISETTIEAHLSRNNLVRDTQHGFRRKRSCLTNLLEFFATVIDTYDNEKLVDIIYLDFQKPFDKVPHQRIMAKLEAHGISVTSQHGYAIG
jgi:hypothetical protein